MLSAGGIRTAAKLTATCVIGKGARGGSAHSGRSFTTPSVWRSQNEPTPADYFAIRQEKCMSLPHPDQVFVLRMVLEYGHGWEVTRWWPDALVDKEVSLSENHLLSAPEHV